MNADRDHSGTTVQAGLSPRADSLKTFGCRLDRGQHLLDDADVTHRFVIPDARDLLFGSLAESTSASRALRVLMECGGRAILFAGAVRDALDAVDRGTPYPTPRDFDIGVFGVRRELFDEVLQDQGGCLNRFGGYRVPVLGSPPLDVWRLEDTWGLRVNGARLTLGSVLRSFVINVNAIAFDPVTAIFYDCGSLRAIKSRQLSFIEGALVHSLGTFAAKAIVGSARFPMQLDGRLLHFSLKYNTAATLLHEARKVFADAAIIHCDSAVRVLDRQPT